MYDTELALFGRVGGLEVVRKGLRLSLAAPAEGHSVKPDEFFARVALASPEPRLEMFARRPHEGFEPWGAEVRDAA
jgi:N6-adenosine-specific RNA methylase IME4